MAWPTTSALLRDLVDWEAEVHPPGGHWPWRVGMLQHLHQSTRCSNAGTPVAIIGGVLQPVRRALWVAVWGELPRGVNIVTGCVEPACVRPAHGHCGPASARHARAHVLDVPALDRWNDAVPAPSGERRGRDHL